MGDNILALYTDEWSYGDFYAVIKTIYAVTIEGASGKKLNEKPVFRHKNTYVDVNVLSDPDGQFRGLFIRHTRSNGGWRRSAPLLATTSLEVISFSDDLLPSDPTELKSAIGEDRFIGCLMTSPHDLFIFTESKELLSVEQLNINTGLSAGKANTSWVNHTFVPTFAYSKAQPDRIYIGMERGLMLKVPIMCVFSFDINTKKFTVYEEKMNMEYADMLEQQSKGARQEKLKMRADVDHLEPVGIVITGDKVTYIRQMRISLSEHADPVKLNTGASFRCRNIVVSVFNRDLKNTGNVAIKRDYHNYLLSGVEVGYKLIGNTLRLIYNVNHGTYWYTSEYAEINIDNIALVKKVAVERPGMRGVSDISPQTTLWLRDVFVLASYRGNKTPGTNLHAIKP